MLPMLLPSSPPRATPHVLPRGRPDAANIVARSFARRVSKSVAKRVANNYRHCVAVNIGFNNCQLLPAIAIHAHKDLVLCHTTTDIVNIGRHCLRGTILLSGFGGADRNVVAVQSIGPQSLSLHKAVLQSAAWEIVRLLRLFRQYAIGFEPNCIRIQPRYPHKCGQLCCRARRRK